MINKKTKEFALDLIFEVFWYSITPFLLFWQKYARFKQKLIKTFNNLYWRKYIYQANKIMYAFRIQQTHSTLENILEEEPESFIILQCMFFLYKHYFILLNINQIFSILLMFNNKIVNLETGEGKTIISVVVSIVNFLIKKKKILL